MIFEDDFIVVIECGLGVEFTIIDAKIETHVIKDITGIVIHFFLGCGEPINEPVERVVLANPLIDKLGVFRRDIGNGTQLFADTVVFKHFDLRKREQLSLGDIIADESNKPTSKGELNIRSPKRMDPRCSGCAFGPPSG